MFPDLYPFNEVENGVHLHLKVTPKASKNRIGDIFQEPSGQNVLKIYVTDPPEDGKANKAVIKLIARKTGFTASLMSIVKGQTDRRKIIFISGNSKEMFKVLSTCF